MNNNVRICKGMDRKLYRASELGDAKSLDQVLEEGTVDVFQEVTPAGDTALHTAAFHGHAPLARRLIQLALDNPEAGMEFLKAQNTDGNTALHVAAKGGCEEIVKGLVEKYRGLACVKNKAGETALFKASEKGHVGMVECLLNCTPQSEGMDRRADGQTPLHVAVSQLRTGVTSKLLDQRPTLVHVADVGDRTVLHILALVPLWRNNTIIERIGKMLLDKEISLVYRIDVNEQSALHLAAKVGNVSLVKIILSNGTDCTHILDKDGRTALHLAVENASELCWTFGRYTVKEIISSLALGRLIDCSDNSGQTALDIAIQKTDKDKALFQAITAYLRGHGAREKMFTTETRSIKSNWRMEIVSVNAVLIATVAFGAAFTLPGNIDSDANPPVPFLLNVSLFKLFIIFDSLAFCSSMGSAVLVMAALYGNQEEDPLITRHCLWGLQVALTSIALAFGAAVHLMVARKCMWLAVLVWIMVCYLPIRVWLTSIQGKLFLFKEYWKYTTVLLMANDMLVCILWPLSLWGYLSWRMVIPMLSWTRKKRREEAGPIVDGQMPMTA